ncbi:MULTISPECIES: hypothetical protein [Aeromonas]|uniref:Phage tail protein n=2 Tax=Aeromonas TaxID=642 RepID=A0ABX6NUI9_AERME|nr:MULTISPECIES: hypothetical protein [Aeromonas]MCR3891494.1 hypothetical protein [Aeromonas caviae]QJT34477.1 hypothetical protein E4187_09030 [Aeromonas media]QJT40053.1 hypothetical protein E4188_17185 [Aeromonas media]WFF97146.1 hypothetical protein P5S46_16000 [Aeromonas caviae]
MVTKKKTALTAASLLQKMSFRHERVQVPELGDDAEIIVREMSVNKLLEYQVTNFNQVTGQPLAEHPFQWMMSLLVCCMVDEDGSPIATQDDVPALMEHLPMSVVDRLTEVAKRLNRMEERALAAEKNDKGQPDQAAGDQVSDRSA